MLPAEAAGATSARARVLLVDDHALLRTGVANIINQEPDLRVVAEAGNGVEAIKAYEQHHPDVTLLDLRMPVMEGVEVVRRIRERDPRARVIVLTTYDTDDEISRALKAGAKMHARSSFRVWGRLGGGWALFGVEEPAATPGSPGVLSVCVREEAGGATWGRAPAAGGSPACRAGLSTRRCRSARTPRRRARRA